MMRNISMVKFEAQDRIICYIKYQLYQNYKRKISAMLHMASTIVLFSN